MLHDVKNPTIIYTYTTLPKQAMASHKTGENNSLNKSSAMIFRPSMINDLTRADCGVGAGGENCEREPGVPAVGSVVVVELEVGFEVHIRRYEGLDREVRRPTPSQWLVDNNQ